MQIAVLVNICLMTGLAAPTVVSQAADPPTCWVGQCQNAVRGNDGLCGVCIPGYSMVANRGKPPSLRVYVYRSMG